MDEFAFKVEPDKKIETGRELVVGIGEVLFDVLPTGRKLGGAPGNFAYHVTEHGLKGVAVSAIGADELGDEAAAILREAGVAAVLPRVEFPTGTVQVTLDGAGVPTYEIRTGVAWDHIPWTEEMRSVAGRCAAVCWGTLAQRSEGSRATIGAFLDAVGGECLKIFDINLRQAFYTREVIEESLRRADILKINDEELEVVGKMMGRGESAAEGVCEWLREAFGLRMVVLTCGAKGSVVMGAEGVSRLATPKVEVVDTVGAGDSFTATFCAGLLKGLSMGEAHRRAVEVSAYVCTQSGAMCRLPESLKV